MDRFFAAVHQEYLNFLLTPHYDHLASEVRRTGISTDAMVDYVFSSTSRRQLLIDNTPRVLEFVDGLWDRLGEAYRLEVRQLPGLKAAFGGDVGPQHFERLYERAGLYFDTIIVPDPLHRVARLPGLTEEARARLLTKYAITLALSREAFVADVDPPLAVLVPDDEFTQGATDGVQAQADAHTVLRMRELFGEPFDAVADLRAFLARFRSADDAVSAIRHPAPNVFTARGGADAVAQWAACKQDFADDFVPNTGFDLRSPQAVFELINSRLLNVELSLTRADYYGAQPLVTAPVAYSWLAWMGDTAKASLATRIPAVDSLDLPLTRGLLTEKLSWLGNVDVAGVVDLRRRGILAEMRQAIRENCALLANIPLSEIERIGMQVDHGLAAAIRRHQEEIKDLEQSTARDFTIAAVGASAALTVRMVPILGGYAQAWADAIQLIGGSGSVVRLLDVVGKYYTQRRKLERSVLGILWSAASKEV